MYGANVQVSNEYNQKNGLKETLNQVLDFRNKVVKLKLASLFQSRINIGIVGFLLSNSKNDFD